MILTGYAVLHLPLKDGMRIHDMSVPTQLTVPSRWFNFKDENPRAHLLQALTVAVTSICAVFLMQIIYRLYLHPLAKIPGPRLAAVTVYWRWYYEIKGVLPYKLKQLQKDHDWPPIIRIGPNDVVIHDPTQYDVIYKVNSKFMKDRNFYGIATSGRNGGTTVTTW